MPSREISDLRNRRLRAAIANLDPSQVRDVVRSVDRPILAQLHPVLRTSLSRLRSARDPQANLALPHFYPALEYVAQAVTADCLDDTRAALGDAADDPTLDQLRRALTEISAEHTPDVVAVMLAITAAIDAPAASACDQILATDPAYGLREEDLAPAKAEPHPR